MKKLTAFILATILVSVGMTQFTMAGYGGGYSNTSTGGGTASNVAVGTTTVTGGTDGNCLTIASGLIGNGACGGTATSIVIGTTTVGSGTTGYLLYNNAGVLGNLNPAGLTLAWGQITGTPTTIAGYGITDAFNSSVPTPIGATTRNTGAFTNLTLTTTLTVPNGGSGAGTLTGYLKGNGTSAFTASSTIPNTDITGLGTMSTQAASNVAITGGTIDGTVIGGVTPAAGTFTALNVSSCTGCGGGTTTYAVSVIQTVISGPVDANGAANFLPASTTGLNFTTQNITGSIPLIATAVNGFNSSGKLSTIGIQSSNFTFTSLPNTTTSYLFVTVSAGALTTGSTTTAPTYQYTGTASTLNGKYTYIVTDSKMYLGNGSTASQVNVVFVGEAVASGGNVTSSVNYAYNGYFRSVNTAMPGNGLTTFNHNIGIQDIDAGSLLVNTVAQLGYSVGDFAYPQSFNGSNFPHYNGIALTSRNALQRYTDSSQDVVVSRSSPGTLASVTAGDWNLIVFAKRRW